MIPKTDLKFVENLIWFDGPLLSLSRGADGIPFLWAWADTFGSGSSNGFNRWCVFPVTEEALDAYRSRQKTLRALFFEAEKIALIDLCDDLTIREEKEMTPGELPEKYLPAEDSLLPA